jgi:peptidoglycan/LPS O-acetylase OafA/YrhL
MKHERKFVWLDLVRGASAIAVCAGHLRNAIVRDYVELHAPNAFQQFFYIVTGMGHQAVMVFFVLSGFFVGGSILRSGKKFRASEYAIARLTRLWVVLIPALFMTLAIDHVVAAKAPEVFHGAYVAIWHSGPSADEIFSTFSTSILTFLGNVFFLQGILTPVFGTNGPLWSLANEFWYYAIFPLTVIALGYCGASGKGWLRLLSGITAASLMLALHGRILSGYFVWLMGVIAYLLCNKLQSKKRPLGLLCALSIFSISLAYGRGRLAAYHAPLGLSGDFIVGLGFFTVCVVIARWPAPRESFLGIVAEKFVRTLSDFSYSLYLCHFPIIIVIAIFGYKSAKVLPDLPGLLQFFGWLVVLLSLGMLFWFLFERHTRFIRDLANRRLKGR